ncbi:hypothetical protein HGRIS_001417 [Hohenbuehelia grisea]|uniref:Uncharacterized protein n=1 Tax=Hohenbuehelia grisea TaxID=104357 RepID=A0ABR3JPA0_9AGAR
MELIPPKCGKTKTLIRHLADECMLWDDSSKAKIDSHLSKGKDTDTSSDDDIEPAPSSNSSSKKPGTTRQSQFTVVATVPWNTDTQCMFVSDLCKLWIALNIAWNGLDNPWTTWFFKKWLPSAVVPQRKLFSGKFLDNEYNLMVEETRREVSGEYATGYVDGWKNIAKESVQATGFYVNGKEKPLNVHNVTAEKKTAENLFAIVKSDIAAMLFSSDGAVTREAILAACVVYFLRRCHG